MHSGGGMGATDGGDAVYACAYCTSWSVATCSAEHQHGSNSIIQRLKPKDIAVRGRERRSSGIHTTNVKLSRALSLCWCGSQPPTSRAPGLPHPTPSPLQHYSHHHPTLCNTLATGPNSPGATVSLTLGHPRIFVC